MKWLLAVLPVVAAAPALPEFTADVPPAGSVLINSVGYGGTGCPQGSMSAQISPDRTVVTLIFDSYIASIGSGISVTENRKNCQLNVGLTYPGGFQYSILSADYRGYAAIDKGIKGTLKSTYYFSGDSAQTSTEYAFEGPVNGDYKKHDEADSTSIIWSPCGASGMLNINSQVRLEKLSGASSSATGLLTTDSTDLKFSQVVYVQWQKCTK